MTRRAKTGAGGALLLAFLIAGCATIEQLAPPVDEAILRAAATLDASAVQVQRGREVYVTTCARCHSPEPVTGHSLVQWRSILPRMAQEAALSEDDRTAVDAYITAVLAIHQPPAR